ncbi:MAG TPA: hypothetical protein VFS13_11200 [Steroidobacteraceae bacterium]|jgi:hypothetical protein|nr:hypothetical protein [Steroidobacteraceae bacterium]
MQRSVRRAAATRLSLLLLVWAASCHAAESWPSWLEEAYMARVVLQPPRLYTADSSIAVDEAYFLHKLTVMSTSTAVARDWRAAQDSCKRKLQPGCAAGFAYAQLLDICMLEYARRLSQKFTNDSDTEASTVLPIAVSKIVAPGGFDREAAYREVNAFLRSVLLVRFGRESTFISVQSPDSIAGWLRKREPKSTRKKLDVPTSQNPEVAILQMYSQNVCPLLQGRENLFCRVLFERAPLNSLDYLLYTPTKFESQPLLRLVDYQVAYIAGQESGSFDWWRTLFPLRYGEYGDLGSGWGDRATLAMRRSKRPLPSVIVEAMQRRISELSATTGILAKPFLQKVNVIFPEAPAFQPKSSWEDASISVFGFEFGGRRKKSGPEAPAATEFLKRLADPTAQVSLQAGDADTIANLLAPGLLTLGADAYRIQATWQGGSPRIVLSEPILLNEYSRCLAHAEGQAEDATSELQMDRLTFGKLLVLLHAHAIDLAALDSQLQLDPDARAILKLSPFFDSLSVDAVDRRVGRTGIAAGIGAILEVVDKKLASRLAKGWVLPSQCVVDRLSFAMAHEVAHIALGSQGEIDADESRADCVGLLLTRAMNVKEAMPLSSVARIGPALYWNARGPTTDQQIRARQARLDALGNAVPNAEAALRALRSSYALNQLCMAN